MEDVAQLTGLSRTTVDRVLNNRPGVKEATREKVAQALRTLGYAQSALVRLSESTVPHIEILLSQGKNPFFTEMRRGMEAAIRPYTLAGYDIRIRGFDPYDPGHIISAIEGVDPKTTVLLSVGMDTPDVQAALKAQKQRGLRVVTLIADVPGSGRDAFVGQDNFRAGRTAARLMSGLIPEPGGDIAVLLGHLQFRHLLDRHAGFQQVIGMDRSDLLCHLSRPFDDDPDELEAVLSELHTTCPALKGIYVVGGLRPAMLERLHAFPDAVAIAHELSDASRAALLDDRLDAVIAHDVHDLARKAVATALDPETGDTPCTIQVYLKDNLP